MQIHYLLLELHIFGLEPCPVFRLLTDRQNPKRRVATSGLANLAILGDLGIRTVGISMVRTWTRTGYIVWRRALNLWGIV